MFISRFAPSVSGLIHLGSLRLLLFIELILSNLNYILYIRLDDTDVYLNKYIKYYYFNFILLIINLLKIRYIKYIFIQSLRLRIYIKYLVLLNNKNLVLNYHGSYLLLINNLLIYRDLIYGYFINYCYNLVCLYKSNGFPSYNFCSVLDDLLININFIIRGNEHIINISIQLYLLNILCYYYLYLFHIGYLLNYNGKKFSKKDNNYYSIKYCLNQGILFNSIKLYLIYKNINFSVNYNIINYDLIKFNYIKLLWINRLLFNFITLIDKLESLFKNIRLVNIDYKLINYISNYFNNISKYLIFKKLVNYIKKYNGNNYSFLCLKYFLSIPYVYLYLFKYKSLIGYRYVFSLLNLKNLIMFIVILNRLFINKNVFIIKISRLIINYVLLI